MATATETTIDAETAEVLDPITRDPFTQRMEFGLIPRERRAFLRDGRLYEKRAKSHPPAAQ